MNNFRRNIYKNENTIVINNNCKLFDSFTYKTAGTSNVTISLDYIDCSGNNQIISDTYPGTNGNIETGYLFEPICVKENSVTKTSGSIGTLYSVNYTTDC
jgi:hypothetical protein